MLLSSLGAKRIGILGGTFDPIHWAHLELAKAATEAVPLDEVAWVPARQSPHKSTGGEAGPGDRAEMVRRALEGHPKFRLVPWELHRPGLSFSIDTAQKFKESYPSSDLFWIMGSDQWSALESWRAWQDLARLVIFVVFPRPDPPEPKPGVQFLPLNLRLDLSSSAVREAIHRKQPWRHLVPKPVADYITARNLYA